MTLIELRNLIKKEAKVSGSDNLDSWIDALINELLLSFCLQKKYYELLITNQFVTTVEGQEQYPLPDGFNFMQLVRYKTAQGKIFRTLLPRNEFVDSVGESGLPRFYQLTGTTLKLMPYVDIPNNDFIYYDFYTYPDLLTENSIIPIPRLIAPIKQRAVYRTHIYNNSLQQAAALKGDSVETETRSHTPNDS